MFEYLIAFGAGLISFLSPCVLPLIPGYISYISCQSLQEILNQRKINIFPLPGASAVSTAVSISGFSEKYFFYGFFPSKLKDIKNDLKLLSQLDSSIVFFISSKKMNK